MADQDVKDILEVEKEQQTHFISKETILSAVKVEIHYYIFPSNDILFYRIQKG